MHHNRQRISLHDLTALRVDVNGERIMSLRHRSKKQVLSVGADVRGNVVALRPFVKLRKHQLELSEDQATLPGMVAPDGERKGKRLKKYHDYPVLLPFLHLPTSSGQFNETQNATDILPSSVGANFQNNSQNHSFITLGPSESHPLLCQLLL